MSHDREHAGGTGELGRGQGHEDRKGFPALHQVRLELRLGRSLRMRPFHLDVCRRPRTARCEAPAEVKERFHNEITGDRGDGDIADNQGIGHLRRAHEADRGHISRPVAGGTERSPREYPARLSVSDHRATLIRGSETCPFSPSAAYR